MVVFIETAPVDGDIGGVYVLLRQLPFYYRILSHPGCPPRIHRLRLADNGANFIVADDYFWAGGLLAGYNKRDANEKLKSQISKKRQLQQQVASITNVNDKTSSLIKPTSIRS